MNHNLVDRIQQDLTDGLSPLRLTHVLGVADTARQLALQHGQDADQAYLAGLLHDIAREWDYERLKAASAHLTLPFDREDRQNKELLHAFVGADIAARHYGVTDEPVLQAIRSHTLARAAMTPLELIILISDKIEPNRHYPGVDDLRQLATQSLLQAALACLNQSLTITIKRGIAIHLWTVEARNDLLTQIKKQGGP
ncbi:bis(5'-nucleosyl)-tetraphosphatase (symmetrical) YqeK [Heliophilum fasciatum]|uniref:bis(5'-nucleosyl)-tetraphosphatase (symmetrical) n=1 Tax=Heliophilum fasciatum TaxID=35700 RepID=A0A4R2RYT9_9FIRM|nr:bis(5'-nucleosyl)-tetraphosphatase (symmetrical) YqeK [Heliophilum fasciatum]MCW2277114.1 putative HD superfamily hydrolase involved in NAD metabolism [Heliophilum fasciatum]TCP68249.1 putative HD superfamily hydrolase involved in NAD metabolism [Heliophilum fasciatum]